MLTDRQLMIFKVIIDDFIESAQPVGSRKISGKDHINISAATIRNVMAELEEMGFLTKTHTSSGRIPSEKGYRYYVDHIISPRLGQDDNLHLLKDFIKDGFLEFEQVVKMSAEVLSELTNYTSIILGPEVFATKLSQIQIITLSNRIAVAILITDSGHVEHRSFTIPHTIEAADMEKMVNILNDRLQGVPIIQLADKLNTEVYTLMKKYIKDVNQSFMLLKEILHYEQPTDVYIGGKSNILMQPEFKDVDKIHSFYTMLENEEQLRHLLTNKHDGLKVTIGNENQMEAFKDFSLITTSYHLGVDQLGTIALLGPTRMEYQKVIRLLKSLSTEMTEVLYMMYNKND